MTDTIAGVDVSKWQDPARVNWGALAAEHKFLIARASYGSTQDHRFAEHIKRARAVGLAVGAYHFWRSTESNAIQWAAFADQLSSVRMGPGDILPAVDIEDDPGAPAAERDVCSEWSQRASEFAAMVAARFGGCVVYLSERDWRRLGYPEWPADYPSWVPHWTTAAHPRTPGGWHYAIWQCRVGKMPAIYGGDLDQNIARLPLPTILDPDQERRRVESVIATTLAAIRENA